MPDSGSLDQEAASWIAQIAGGSMSGEDRLALAEWIARSPGHARAIRSMAALWGNIDDTLDELLLERKKTSLTETLVAWFSARPIQFSGALATAAVVAGALFLVPATLLSPSDPAASGAQIAVQEAIGELEVYETAKGKTETITLTDGSTIHLNTDSVIQVRFSSDKREVKLLRGEGLFEVAKDADRPFRVYAGGELVEAIGTAFVVRVESDVMAVTVTEGKVSVDTIADDGVPTPASEESEEPRERRFVTAGQRLRIKAGLGEVEKVDQQQIEQQIAWRSGLIIFNGETLEECLAEIGRYRSERIVIADPELRTRKVGGVFKVGELDALLSALEISMDINVDRVDENVIYLSSK